MTTGLCNRIEDDGTQCPAPARFWVGSNGVDDYLLLCGDHVEDLRRPDDTVVPLEVER